MRKTLSVIVISLALAQTYKKTTFLTGANRTFTEIKHLPIYTINLSRLQKTEILQSMFSDHEEFN